MDGHETCLENDAGRQKPVSERPGCQRRAEGRRSEKHEEDGGERGKRVQDCGGDEVETQRIRLRPQQFQEQSAIFIEPGQQKRQLKECADGQA